VSQHAFLAVERGHTIAAVAFVYGGQDRDWLAYVSRRAGEPWTTHWRFRYYAEGADQDPWNGKDERSVWSAKAADGSEASREKSLAMMRLSAETLVAHGYNDAIDWLEVGSDDPDVVLALLATRSWVHRRVEGLPG
jgi:hypothetical protein